MESFVGCIKLLPDSFDFEAWSCSTIRSLALDRFKRAQRDFWPFASPFLSFFLRLVFKQNRSGKRSCCKWSRLDGCDSRVLLIFLYDRSSFQVDTMIYIYICSVQSWNIVNFKQNFREFKQFIQIDAKTLLKSLIKLCFIY